MRFSFYIKLLTAFAVFCEIVVIATVLAQSPIKAFPPGTFSNKAALDPPPVSGYQGPGDVFGGGYAWFSCARAYNLAYANGTNPMCDLVDATTGAVAVCTLRAATTGFVDLTGNYCTGSTTPSLACAAAAGGACRVKQAYDQTGNTRHSTQATAANMLSLVFSASPGSATLPIMRCASGVTCFLATANVTQAQPITLTAVFQRTANFTTEGIVIGTGGGLIGIGVTTSANTAQVKAGSAQTATANDSTWHSLVGLLNNTACAINVDGSDTAGVTCGASGWSATPIRINRGGGGQIAGDIAEVGMWAATSTSTDRNNLSTNAHSSANGYNF